MKALRKIEKIESLDLYEMSNLVQKRTGLPMIIYISTKAFSKHGPRIKVQTNHSQKTSANSFVSISISDDPKIMAGTGLSNKDFEIVKKFILENKKILLDFWNENIDVGDVLENLKKSE